jgi:hypothetical protein
MADLSYIIEDLRPLAVPIDDVQPDPENAMGHEDEDIEEIQRSLELYGQRKPIVVNESNKLIEAGNGTWEAAKRAGWTHIAAVFVQDDDRTATGYAIADNRTAQLSGWLYDVLRSRLEDGFEDPTEVPGVDPGLWAEVQEQASLAAAVREMLNGDADGLGRDLGDVKKQIKPVLYAEDVAVFERAIVATGIRNRAEALLEVCAYYLLNNEAGQQYLPEEGDAPEDDAGAGGGDGPGAGGDGDARRDGEDLLGLLQDG